MRKTAMHHTQDGQGGFSLVELLVTLTLTLWVILGVAHVLDSAQTLYTAQMNVAEMQQSARGAMADITRHLRMLGRGGLPAASAGMPWPDGISLAVANNVPTGTRILKGVASAPAVAPHTDILTVRGVFDSPILQLDATDPTSFVQRSNDPRAGDLWLESTSPAGLPQDLESLIDSVRESQGRPHEPPIREALLLVGPADPTTYAVVQLDPLESNVSNPDRIRLRFVLEDPSKDPDEHYANRYATLNPEGAFPQELWESRVGFMGVLEEHRFYVRQDPGGGSEEIAGNPVPRLSRAWVYPATESPHRNDDDLLALDIAERVVDLQVALGVDDDWLFDGTADDFVASLSGLHAVRVTALVRTRRRDRAHMSRPIDAIEDRDYTTDAHNDRTARLFHRTLVQAVVDLRNL